MSLSSMSGLIQNTENLHLTEPVIDTVADKAAKHAWLLQKLQSAQGELQLGAYREIQCQYPDGRKRCYLIHKDQTSQVQAWRIHDNASLNEPKSGNTKGKINYINEGGYRTVYKINAFTLQADKFVKTKSKALSLKDIKEDVTNPYREPKDQEIREKLQAAGLTPRGMALRHVHGDVLVGDLYQSNLFDYFQTHGCLGFREFRNLMPDLLEAMVQMQEIEYLHLDLNPQNILLKKDEKGAMKLALCDFDGEFGKITSQQGKAPYLSLQDCLLIKETKLDGTQDYTFLDFHKQQDIPSLGLVMLDMLCGDWERYIKATETCIPVDLKKYVASADALLKENYIPKAASELILDMLNPDFEKRPDAKEVQKRFSAIKS